MRYRLTVLCGVLALAPGAFAARYAPADFKAMDADRDGRLTSDEHAAGAERMFALMDADEDGTVTAAEMDAAHERVTGRKAKPGDMSAADKIKAVDTNGDGALSGDEHAAGARTMFDKMDADKDGALGEAEFAAGHKETRKPPSR